MATDRADAQKEEGERSTRRSSVDQYEGGCWAQFRMKTRLLRSALKASPAGEDLEQQLRNLLSDCLSIYISSSQNLTHKGLGSLVSDCHERKRTAAAGERSYSLEPAFTWLGGWRPTSALVLVYSALGYDSQGEQLTSSPFHTQSSELSESQLCSMSNLKKHTRKTEDELSHQFARFQMLLADQAMVKALVSEAASSMRDSSEAQITVESKIQSLVDFSKQAEKVRIETLHELFNLLTPLQAARCSIAAFELAFAIKSLTTTSSTPLPPHPST